MVSLLVDAIDSHIDGLLETQELVILEKVLHKSP